MLTIPLVPGENQKTDVFINNQLLTIYIYGNSTGVYLDLYSNGVVVRTSILCLDRVQMVTESYHGFNGRLQFTDQQGSNDPTIDLIGSRFLLRYLQKGIDY